MVPPADNLAELERRIARVIRDPSTAALEAASRAIPPELEASGPALALRGELLRRGGDAAGAVRVLEGAVERAPALLGAYHALALARVRTGDRAGARSAWLALLERDPDDPTARYQIALAFHEDGDRGEAARWYEAQVARHPSSPRAWHNLGLLRLATGDAGGAVAALREAVAGAPDAAPAWTALGRALARTGDTAAAIEAWTRAHAVDPRAIEPLERRAAALGERAALPAAIATLREAIAIDSRKPSLRLSLAAHLSSLGEHADALAELREAVALAPADAAGHSALLFELQYDDALATREDVALEHRRWARRHADGLPPVHRPARARPPDRMRVGYLSPRYGMGPLATLFLPVLESHDRTRCEIVLYSTHPHEGPVNARFRRAAEAWRDLPQDDASAAAMIADDGLDLLVDLAGHAPGHRLGVLARRPAPVQATWLDYFETTGMRSVDYFVSDAVCTPASDAALFRERLVQLPCRFAYRPLDSPAVTPAPAAARGHVTFGSFNRHAKLSPATLDAWGEILRAAPDSRLALRAAAYGGQGTVEWIRDRWARRGLPVDRIDFLPWLPWREALAAYADVDIALDPFPYNGGATTCDALAHGVPVVALAGERPIARQSASLLRAAGHPEWIARSTDAYVRLAVELARSGSLDRTRRELHAGMPHSALCDVGRFARSLERAFAAMIAAGECRDEPRAREPLAVA